MKLFRSTGGLFVRLDRGEDLLGKLTELFTEERVGAAVLHGIGAVEKTTLGYFDVDRRDYLRREYAGSMELVSLDGNLAWTSPADGGDETPIIHAHAVIAGADNIAHAGHLFAARISVTGEVMVWTSDERRRRTLDDATGLKLLS